MLIGIVGKPNCGKTTFLNAACLTTAKVADYPFTTIEPNLGTAYVRTPCVCKELNVKDNPKNSICLNGTRLIPIELLDVAGLVPGAWEGKGLGNKFLDDLRRADALIHVVDASGSTDAEGKLTKPGSWDPIEDIKFLEYEIVMWITNLLKRDWHKFTRKIEVERLSFVDMMAQRLSGLSINKSHINTALKNAKLIGTKPNKWDDGQIYNFAAALRKTAKPLLIVANKADIKTSDENIMRIKEFTDDPVIPACVLGEYYLRKFAEDGKIKYIPGDKTFEILKNDAFTEQELKILNNLQELMDKLGSTGVQKALDTAVFDLLGRIVVYPVHEVSNYSDRDGNVLPDAFLVQKGINIKDFASKVHTELAETFIHGIDAKTKKRLSENYELQNCDVVKFVSAKGR
ncbi:MAG: redox-regulated ATPase YchF [Candidatus Helarchaeota archaeon]